VLPAAPVVVPELPDEPHAVPPAPDPPATGEMEILPAPPPVDVMLDKMLSLPTVELLALVQPVPPAPTVIELVPVKDKAVPVL
jgi:hypothetical protein